MLNLCESPKEQCIYQLAIENSLKTSVRNRLGSERVDDLMAVSTEGEDLEQFDFGAALQHLRKKKDRRIFTG